MVLVWVWLVADWFVCLRSGFCGARAMDRDLCCTAEAAARGPKPWLLVAAAAAVPME